MKLVYTAISKKLFYFRMHISKFVLEKNSIESVISSIIEKHPDLKPLLIDGDSLKLKKNVSIAINDKIIEKNRKETSILKENDKIAFLLPISGG